MRRKFKKQNFSVETEKSFDMIEREKAIEYYRQLRINPNIKKRKIVSPKIKSRPRQKTRYKRKQYQAQVNKEEQEQEILQKLSYFCMQNRLDSRFSNESEKSSCKAHTHVILENCQKKFSKGTKSLSSCVDSNLK